MRKNPYQLIDYKNLKKNIRESKVSRLLADICDFQKENDNLG
jgi:hypothetical protein